MEQQQSDHNPKWLGTLSAAPKPCTRCLPKGPLEEPRNGILRNPSLSVLLIWLNCWLQACCTSWTVVVMLSLNLLDAINWMASKLNKLINYFQRRPSEKWMLSLSLSSTKCFKRQSHYPSSVNLNCSRSIYFGGGDSYFGDLDVFSLPDCLSPNTPKPALPLLAKI